MKKYFLRFKNELIVALESKYFILFCFVSTLLLIFAKEFFLDLCTFGFLSLRACSAHRIPEYEGYYSFNMFYSYLMTLLFFLVFKKIVLFSSKERSNTKNISLKKRFLVVFLIPVFSGFYFIRDIYKPLRSFVVREAVMDCCEGRLISPWGKFANLDKQQRFCSSRRRLVYENQCVFPMQKDE